MAIFSRLFTAAFIWLTALAALEAQVFLSPPAGATETQSGVEIDGLLRRAQQLETEQRWGEALAVYEDALRDNPSDKNLGTRHDLAKIHYDLGRRYHDSSFLRSLSSLEERDALAMYDEVLTKIQSHYVAEPDWTALVHRGTDSLGVALDESSFARQTNLPATRAEIDNFRHQLAGQMQVRTIRSRQQALDAVSAAVQFARRQLRMAATPVILEYVCGATAALDEYSAYLTGDQLNDVYSQIEGNFVGLGIELKANEGSLLIVKVITASPAERAGIKIQDRITAVGGHSTAELTTDQAADLLQGTEGSQVEIHVQSPSGLARKLVLRREHVDVPSVDDVKIVDRDYGVGYVKLSCFQKTTSRDLDAALWKLQREGMRSLIIDLRANPGGLLTASVEVVDKFVEEGVIVSTRGRSSLEDYNYTAHRAGTWRVPLVVLIDGDSASASEIFAGAIRDHRRGTIVGQRSYGKGSVQGIFPLNVAGAGVRLTTAKFYSPSGQAISRVGVRPDVEVRRAAKPADGQQFATADDEVLAAGLKEARRQTAKR